MLDLAAPAAVDHIVRTRRLDAIAGSLLDSRDTAAPERLLAGDSRVDQVARRGPRDEDDHSSRSANAVTAGGDRVDPNLRHRSPSARAARVHDDIAVAACPGTDCARFGADRSRSAINAAM